MHQAFVITRSTCEPLTRDEAKAWLRLGPDDSEEESLIDALVTVARRTVEDRTRRLFFQSTCALHLDAFPDESTGVVRIPYAPLVSVGAVVSYDTLNMATTMSSSDYVVDTASEPGRIALDAGGTWPSDVRTIDAGVVTCTVGYSSSTQDGSTGLPAEAAPMVSAVKLLLAHLYVHREAVSVGSNQVIPTELPLGVDYLLAQHTLPEVEG